MSLNLNINLTLNQVSITVNKIKRFFAYWVVTIVFGLIAGVIIGGLDAVTAVETYEVAQGLDLSAEEVEEIMQSPPMEFSFADRVRYRSLDVEEQDDALSLMMNIAAADDPERVVYCSGALGDYCFRDRMSIIAAPTIFSFFIALFGFVLVRIVYGSFKIVFQKK